MPRQALIVIAGLICMPLDGVAATYRYDAYFAGLKVGAAEVEVVLDANDYRVEGSAAARGVATFFSDWRSEFYASGIIIDGTPELTTYGFDERERTKHRVLTLADGQVEVVRNGEARSPVPVLEGIDVLTAFFIAPSCWSTQLLHTGQYNYWVNGRPGRQDGCDFQVEDDDGDRSRVQIWFEEHHGRVVPARLSTGGLLKGRIILRSVEGSRAPTYAELDGR